MEKKKYRYSGPVLRYDVCVASHWEAETEAVSASAAIRNLKFRYNVESGYACYLPVRLPGYLREIAA